MKIAKMFLVVLVLFCAVAKAEKGKCYSVDSYLISVDSNIVEKSGELFFIDFGLGFYSKKVEDFINSLISISLCSWFLKSGSKYLKPVKSFFNNSPGILFKDVGFRIVMIDPPVIGTNPN